MTHGEIPQFAERVAQRARTHLVGRSLTRVLARNCARTNDRRLISQLWHELCDLRSALSA